jgi:predicted helicase
VSRLLINQYLNELARIRRVSGTERETVVREAFKDLLKSWGRSLNLQFNAEHAFDTPTKDRRVIDGALLHDLRVPFGYWEAKDSKDDLDAEIALKFRRGYPKTNIIFEDSRHAVLFQHGVEVMRSPVDDVPGLEKLLGLFFSYQRPEIADFRKAITQFKADLPAVLDALRERIDDAYTGNAEFAAAAAAFLAHAKETINPAISDADIREMLIQHVLTEDIFARVFGDSDFHRDNNVAQALDRLERLFLRGGAKQQLLHAIEPYYAAIRSAAALIESHSEKQGFLKAVYENFYKVYNPKAADRLGVIYTPNEIVRFMIESADWLCEKHFGRSLIDRNVEILDPATGTGTFIVELLEHFRGRPAEMTYKYLNELHANEVAILPYYVANLNIEATYAAISGEYLEFPNLCFVDTLDNVAGLGMHAGYQHDLFGAISEENIERVKRQNQRRISVIIGNPPYNAWQENYNQNNPNRPYRRVDERIRTTYAHESTAQNRNSIYDMYTRFVRWASDRIKDEGIIAFIIGRKPFAKAAYDGFRKVVAREFAEIWIVDLGGDVRENPKLSGTRNNVFGIQTGVAIVLLVKKQRQSQAVIRYTRRPEMEAADDKLRFLSGAAMAALDFRAIQPDRRHDWLDQPEHDWRPLLPLVAKPPGTARSAKDRAIFSLFSNGLESKRDQWVYDFDKDKLKAKMEFFISVYNQTTDKSSKEYRNRIKWDREVTRHRAKGILKSFERDRIVVACYRPFLNQWLYFDKHLNAMTFKLDRFFLKNQPNQAICFSDIGARSNWSALAVDRIADRHFGAAVDAYQQVARYRYTKDGERVDNITDWALQQFTAHYGADAAISKDDIFAYVYAVLHDPLYRETYALNLKREFPRIPLYPSFARWRDWGRTLLDLHIGYEAVAPFPLARTDIADEKARASGQPPRPILKADRDNGILILDSETQLAGVPCEAWGYVLGNRSALDWVLDQHKEKTPKDPTIRERFNTYRFADYKEKVVDLLARVTAVSLRTVEITEAMRRQPR